MSSKKSAKRSTRGTSKHHLQYNSNSFSMIGSGHKSASRNATSAGRKKGMTLTNKSGYGLGESKKDELKDEDLESSLRKSRVL